MKLVVIAVIVGLAFCVTSSFAQNQAKDSERDIKKLETDLEAAEIKGDSVTLDRVIAEDYIEIDARGVVTTKADLLKTALAMKAAPQAVSIGPEKTVDDLTMRLHRDTTLVSGRVTTRYHFMNFQTSSAQAQSPAYVEQERFLRVYVKTEGRWRLVAQQFTFVAKQ